MERLTAREPDGIVDVIKQDCSWNLAVSNAICKLAEYEDAEEQGRLIESPFALGDSVWVIVLGGVNPIEETVVTSITKNQYGVILNFGEGMYAYKQSMNLDYYGILFFGSKEEAEEGLRGIEVKKGK